MSVTYTKEELDEFRKLVELADPIIYYVELHGGRCGLNNSSPKSILREQGTANVRNIRPATDYDVAHVRAMGGYVPSGRIVRQRTPKGEK